MISSSLSTVVILATSFFCRASPTPAVAENTVAYTRRDAGGFFIDRVKEYLYIIRGGRQCNCCESFWAIDGAKIFDVLQAYRFTLEYEQGKDGRYYGSLKQIHDIIGDGDDLETLKCDIATYLIDYARGYAQQMQLLFNAPNRRAHFPFILNVLAQDSINGVLALID